MTQQGDLFTPSLAHGLRRPAASADPVTSHDAAPHIVRTGLLGAQLIATLTALRAWHQRHGYAPTSAELAEGDVRLRFTYARRLADLRERRLVMQEPPRPCGATGRLVVTWDLGSV